MMKKAAVCGLLVAIVVVIGLLWIKHHPYEEETKPVVTFLSPTECQGNHGVWRWAVKVDAQQPGEPPNENQEVTVVSIAEMADWKDLDGITSDSPRRSRYIPGDENWFYELVGQVRLVKAEDDGDLHVQLLNMESETGNPQVVVEVPLGEPWNAIREEVFGWADVTFPCHPHELKLKKYPVIRVTGKAFFDAMHQGKIPNRRSYDANVTVWEIHPVMRLEEIP